MVLLNIILISILSSVIFGVIDALFFLTAEDELQDKIESLPYFDLNMAVLLTGGISAAAGTLFAVPGMIKLLA